jgi:hypothetical protein
MKEKELFVYYDPEYDPDCTSWWITPSVSERIVDFLKAKGFQVLKAREMREIMLSVLRREKEKVVIVFAQDVAPDTVLDDPAPIAIIRQYLDNGGSIVWAGDIPFWYQAKEKGQNRDDEAWHSSGAPANVLGISPIFPAQMSKARIRQTGRDVGLQTEWTGIRPVLPQKGIEVLAESDGIAFAYQVLPSKSTWVSRAWDRLSGIRVGAFSVNVGVDLGSPVQNQQSSFLGKRKFANAWFKNFDRNNPNSGFLRVWDYRPPVITDQQLGELYKVAVSTVK